MSFLSLQSASLPFTLNLQMTSLIVSSIEYVDSSGKALNYICSLILSFDWSTLEKGMVHRSNSSQIYESLYKHHNSLLTLNFPLHSLVSIKDRPRSGFDLSYTRINNGAAE